MSKTAQAAPGHLSSFEDAILESESNRLFKAYQMSLWKDTDRLFAWLMIFQWAAAVGIAAFVSPRQWTGNMSVVHPHIYASVFLGALITIPSVVLTVLFPGGLWTRYSIAAAQMLMSALLIHITGGRIETHFHVFGSLAFLAFYRDWRVLVPATVVVAIDHAVRGIYFPFSIFGVLTSSPWRWVEHAGWVVFIDAFLIGSCLRSVAEMRTIARRTAESELLAQRFHTMTDDSPIGVFEVTSAGECVYVNPRFTKISGVEAEQALGDGWLRMLLPEARAIIEQHLGKHASYNHELEIRCELRRIEGESRWVQIETKPLIAEGEITGYIGTLQDVTDRKHAEDRMAHDAYHDSLTGILNRAAFTDALRRSFFQQQRNPTKSFGVLFCDLDRFKAINDTMGHEAGDLLLIEVANRLRLCCRAGDIACRFGGDEFALLLDSLADPRDINIVAHRVHEALRSPISIMGKEIYISASVGMVTADSRYKSPQDILRAADAAMYQSKAQGAGQSILFEAAEEIPESVTGIAGSERDMRS